MTALWGSPSIAAMTDWTDAENNAVVADYFAMLGDELRGRSYNKSEHRRRLAESIDRSEASIEFKRRNVSAVLKGAGETWITGYLPAFNIQRSLEDAVARWVVRNRAWFARTANPTVRGASEAAPLFIDVAPTLRNAPPPLEVDQMQALARRFDVAARDEANRTLGSAGEERVFHHERGSLERAGRGDLARKVRWVAKEDGDGAGYDIASFAPEGGARLIEVKTTNGWERTPFHVSRNELEVAAGNRNSWVLFRLWNFARDARAFELRPPLDAHVALTPTTFQASFH